MKSRIAGRVTRLTLGETGVLCRTAPSSGASNRMGGAVAMGNGGLRGCMSPAEFESISQTRAQARWDEATYSLLAYLQRLDVWLRVVNVGMNRNDSFLSR